MKTRTLTLLLGMFFSFPGITQTQIDNPSFDSVYFGGIDRILEWVTSDGVGIHGVSSDTIIPLQPNTFYSALGLQYSEILDLGVFIDTTPNSYWTLRLKTQPQKYKIDGSSYESYVVNGTHFYTDSVGYIDFSKCGTPFTGTPNALTGIYKFAEQSAVPNFGVCEILLKRYNVNTQTHDTIAYEKEFMTFNYSQNWQPFAIPINYVASPPPDSVVVVFKAGITPHLPATFWVDNLNFEYGTVGIKEIKKDLNIFPNPVIKTISIENSTNKEFSFSIIELGGKIITEGKCTNNIDASSLKNGSYILRQEDEMGQLKNMKFTKL